MFSKFSQKLPFNLLGDDAKLAFRNQSDGIRKLAECKNIEETDLYWEKFVTIFDSTSDVFSLITPYDVRRALVECPANVATLIRFLSSRLFRLMVDHTFPSPPTTTVTSLASSFISTGAGVGVKNTTKEVLNCLRVLERVFPIIFELENDTFEQDLLWTKVQAKLDEEPVLDEYQSQFVIEDEDEDEETGEKPSSEDIKLKTEKKPTFLPSLAERLLDCALDLMFCCGFTLPLKFQVDYHKINYIIWERGVGSTTEPGSNQTLDSNKIEVLRFILVLLSRQIYVSPGSLLTSPSPFAIYLTQQISRRHVLTVLCSLLNTALNQEQQRIGVGSMAARLPYNHIVFKGEDTRTTLCAISFQLMCVLLDFQSGGARDIVVNTSDLFSTAPTVRTNAFRYFVAKIHRGSDFSLILNGVSSILEQHVNATNNVLPSSKKPVPYILETIVFFWKIIELNKKFCSYALEDVRTMNFFAHLLCYALEVKEKPEQHGLCRAISYIIQSLSCRVAFVEKLSSPIKIALPQKWTVPGTMADFMINCIYSTIASSSGSLSAIYPAFIIALSNSAPYLKNVSVESSNKLIRLFIAFSTPSFLLSDEGHPRLLFFILETFNAVILHRLDENPNLIYAILHYHKIFEDLAAFTLADGLRELRRVQRTEDRKGKSVAIDKDILFDADKEGIQFNESSLSSSNSEAHYNVAATFENSSFTPSDERQSSAGRSTDRSLPGQSIASSTLVQSPLQHSGASAVPMSKKSQGKMRARSFSYDMTSSLERMTNTVIGRNGFIPTQEWVTSWQERLPLDIVYLLISELLPKIQEIQASVNNVNSTAVINDFLRSVNLQHIFPQAATSTPRRFVWSDPSIVWLTSLTWGEIYVRGMTPYGIWNATNVRLFYVKHTATQQRQLTEAVSHVVGGLLNRTSESQTAAATARTGTR